MTNLFTSVMRTLVPIVAGLLLGLAAKVGMDLDDATVTAQVTAGLTASYYAVFRLLEDVADRIGAEWLRKIAGVLLGWARPPRYEEEPSEWVRLKLDSSAFEEDLAAAMKRAGLDRGSS